jgi:hypothetical protein
MTALPHSSIHRCRGFKRTVCTAVISPSNDAVGFNPRCVQGLVTMNYEVADQDANSPRAGRWQRRDQRRRAERRRIKKHGAGLRRTYADAIRRRLRKSG